jgi:pyruvate formate lyase activating enzyme
MTVGGVQSTSLIDYPGKVSCVLFLAGCNFRCPYCHNPELVTQRPLGKSYLSYIEVYDFLEERRGLLDGVVLSGGEPTLQTDLVTLCVEVKKMDFLLKLDTNGSHPEVIERLINDGFVDYIAMDLKTDPFRYTPVIASHYDPEQILLSVKLIMESRLPYEFRTTCVKPIVDEEAVKVIRRIIQGAKRYVLQRFNHRNVLLPEYFLKKGSAYDEDELLYLKSLAEPWVQECLVR